MGAGNDDAASAGKKHFSPPDRYPRSLAGCVRIFLGATEKRCCKKTGRAWYVTQVRENFPHPAQSWSAKADTFTEFGICFRFLRRGAKLSPFFSLLIFLLTLKIKQWCARRATKNRITYVRARELFIKFYFAHPAAPNLSPFIMNLPREDTPKSALVLWRE